MCVCVLKDARALRAIKNRDFIFFPHPEGLINSPQRCRLSRDQRVTLTPSRLIRVKKRERKIIIMRRIYNIIYTLYIEIYFYEYINNDIVVVVIGILLSYLSLRRRNRLHTENMYNPTFQTNGGFSLTLRCCNRTIHCPLVSWGADFNPGHKTKGHMKPPSTRIVISREEEVWI